MPATKTLTDCIDDKLETAVDNTSDNDPIVLWWDEGGYLEDRIRSVGDEHGFAFHAADRTPLELRADAPRERTIWYVPQSQTDDTDWFQDVEHTGASIDAHIGTLAVRCFEDDLIQAASLRTTFEEADVNPEGDRDERDAVAQTLYSELDGSGGLPSLQELTTKIVLDGHDDPVQFVLKHGSDNLPDSRDDLLKIRDLLVDRGVAAVEGETDADAIVDCTRRWAVAQWLIDAGLDRDSIPSEFRPPTDDGIGIARPELQSVLSRTDRPEALADIYLDPDHRFWHELLRQHESPWDLAECPVGATLEHELWDAWRRSFDDGEYEQCAEQAQERHDRLDSVYKETPWTRVWNHATDIATLAAELDTWTERTETDDVVNLYGDIDEGTWQIDNAVYNLVVSGTPEDDLPDEHPATATLDELRTAQIETGYLDYLSELGNLTGDQIESGAPFVDHQHADRFFDQEQEHLESGESVALFIVDALRFDLAHNLAERIRAELPRFEVAEDQWVGTLPSETKFGKAALTPGNRFSFNLDMQDGDLVPIRNGKRVTNHRRQQLLENDGWNYITRDGDDGGWSQTRVAYYWNDIDSMGEKELTDFEALFEERVETIADIICEKLDLGEFDRAYVITDHGFVSLPSHFDLNDIAPPATAEDINRRWIAGEEMDEEAPGIRLDEDAHLGYIDDDVVVSALADPTERFSNQGLSDARFYHGGLLPQEFVLNFLTITPE
jgi:hypothetical protein